VKNPYLIGAKVYLRPLEPEDAVPLSAWLNDPAVGEIMGIRRPSHEESARRFLAKSAKDPRQVGFGIALRRDDRLVGTTVLHHISHQRRSAALGVAVGAPAVRGRGVGTEAVRLLLGYAFETLNLNRVWLHVVASNEAARRVYANLGFVHEGTLREEAWSAGRYENVLVMGLLRGEWEARSGR